MDNSLNSALDGFIQQYVQHHQTLSIEFDPDWPSACYLASADAGDLVGWQPVRQSQPGNWQDFETALSLQLHPSIASYYQGYWSDNLKARHALGNLELIQVWNDDDFARLQQNLIGHILMKRRLKQADTVFFALTDEEDMILSVDNASGAVVLEQVGLPPKRTLAANLSEFIQTLTPR